MRRQSKQTWQNLEHNDGRRRRCISRNKSASRHHTTKKHLEKADQTRSHPHNNSKNPTHTKMRVAATAASRASAKAAVKAADAKATGKGDSKAEKGEKGEK